MQDSSDSQPIGEIVSTPPSVQINSQQLTGAVQAPIMGQQVMQQNIMYIQMPKFKHPIRIWSYVLMIVGILIYFASFVIGGFETMFELGYGTCCMFFNAAFVCEIVFYYNMMQHNQSYGQGIGWAVTNIVFAVILTIIGLFIALGMFLSASGL